MMLWNAYKWTRRKKSLKVMSSSWAGTKFWNREDRVKKWLNNKMNFKNNQMRRKNKKSKLSWRTRIKKTNQKFRILRTLRIRSYLMINKTPLNRVLLQSLHHQNFQEIRALWHLDRLDSLRTISTSQMSPMSHNHHLSIQWHLNW